MDLPARFAICLLGDAISIAVGLVVAMTGGGTTDAPALAQSDVGVANTGTQAAREAGNMVDLDSNPTDVAILPAFFAATRATAGSATGPLDRLNLMGLGGPESAIVSAIIFNALIIPLLVPLARRGTCLAPERGRRD